MGWTKEKINRARTHIQTHCCLPAGAALAGCSFGTSSRALDFLNCKMRVIALLGLW